MAILIPKHGVLHPHGVLIVNDPAAAHEIQADTLQCCHCGRSWVYRPGSGRTRGFCTRCHRVTCGAPKCNACVPLER